MKCADRLCAISMLLLLLHAGCAAGDSVSDREWSSAGSDSFLGEYPAAVRENPPPYSFCMMNRSGKFLRSTMLHWGDLSLELSAKTVAGSASMNFYDDPIPRKARVSWVTEDGFTGDGKVEVPEFSLEQLEDGITFCFVILPDGRVKMGAYSDDEYFGTSGENKAMALARDGGPAYTIKTKNASGKDLQGVRVYFGENLVNGAPYEAIAAHNEYGSWSNPSYGIPYPVTETARVVFVTPDGTEHEEEVDLKSGRPDDLNDVCIAFVIDPESRVHVRFLPWAERDAWRDRDLLK